MIAPGLPVSEPDLTTLLQGVKDDIFATLNCAQIGTIQSFNAAKQTATVSLNFRRVVYNQTQQLDAPPAPPAVIAYPLLTDVPVFVLNGGGAVMTMPIGAGDTCILLFNDRNLDTWYSTGAIAQPLTPRAHSLSDGMALVGVRSLANLIAGYSTTAAELKYGGGVVSVNAKLGLSNASISLLSVLSNLITTLQNWVDTHGDTPSGGTLSALATNLTQIQSLLR